MPEEGVSVTPKDLFIDQMARKRMVDWCHNAVMGGLSPKYFAIREIPMLPAIHPDNIEMTSNPYLDHAISKGWVSKDGERILAAGWKIATSFLKR